MGTVKPEVNSMGSRQATLGPNLSSSWSANLCKSLSLGISVFPSIKWR